MNRPDHTPLADPPSQWELKLIREASVCIVTVRDSRTEGADEIEQPASSRGGSSRVSKPLWIAEESGYGDP